MAFSLESTRYSSSEVKSDTTQTESMHALQSLAVKFKKSKQGFRNPRKDSFNQNQKQYACYGCGANHDRSDCPHRNSECNKCHKIGHLARIAQILILNYQLYK